MTSEIAQSVDVAEKRVPERTRARRQPVRVHAVDTVTAIDRNPLARAHSPLASSAGSAAGAMSLQRLAGNAAVGRLIATNRGAMPDRAVQRAVAQRLATENDAALAESAHSPVLDVVGHGGGAPLDSQARAAMETSFGRDFSAVRIHSGSAAAASAASVQALAYTVGNEIVMPGGVNPSNEASMHTLAHELAHVTQQGSGPVDGTPSAGGISVSDPGDRFEQEAERTAVRVMSGFGGA